MSDNQDNLREELAKIEHSIVEMEITNGLVLQVSLDAALVSLLAKQTSLFTKRRGPGANAYSHCMALDEGVRAGGDVHGTVIVGEGIVGDVVGREVRI